MEREAGILLVGRHAPLMDLLAEEMRLYSRLLVVGVAGTGEQAVRMLGERAAGLVLMDVAAAGDGHFDAARAIRAVRPSIHIVFLSGDLQDAVIEQALAVGARGFVLRRNPPGTILAAIHEVLDGGCCFPAEVQSRIIVDAEGMRLAGAGDGAREEPGGG